MKFIVIIAVFVVGGMHAESLFNAKRPYSSRREYLNNIIVHLLPRNQFTDIISSMRAFAAELSGLPANFPSRRYKTIEQLIRFAIKGAKIARDNPSAINNDLKIKPTIYVPILQIITRLKPLKRG